MYLLINNDGSINYGNNHPIDDSLDFEGLTLLEFPDKTLEEVVGDVKPYEAYWDESTQTVIRDPRITKSEDLEEKSWRNKEIQNVLNKIDQYERDQRIPHEFRTTKLNESDYHNLLRYRKSLCEYPETNNYTLKIRPQLAN